MTKSIRFPHYDYSTAGAYFLTLCTHDKDILLGTIIEGVVRLNEYGRIVEREWLRSAEIRRELRMGDYVIMPNHLHGVVFIIEDDRAHCRAALPEVYTRGSRDREPRSVSSFLAGFKSYTTKLVNELRGTPGARFWQPNYFEHIIRNQRQFDTACKYIQTNPHRWESDKYYPQSR